MKPKKTIADELPYLGGMEVVEEVFALISRLEMDRQQTETDLFNQKQRARLLQKRTDELAARRAREFPIAVQAGTYIDIRLTKEFITMQHTT